MSNGRTTVAKLLGLALLVLLVPFGTRDAEAAGRPACEESLQAEIDAARPNGTVELAEDCIYRESVTIGKPMTLAGRGAGEIRGSEVWNGWRADGPLWVSAETVPELAVPGRDRCEDGGERCLWPEQVFLDGRPLTQVASGPRTGQFALDAGRRVLLTDDPEGRTVEVTVREGWVVGAAEGVTVEGVTMKHAGRNGLWNGGYSGWTVRGNDLSHAHAKNLALTLGDSLVAEGNRIHHGGQLGMSSNDAELRALGNRVWSNNTEGFDPGWEAGGIKISQPRVAVVAGNEVYDNNDIGIWTDVVGEDQEWVEVSGNRVHHHPREGIRVEITKNFSVRDNVVWENGWGRGDSYTGAGISVNGSRDGVVEDNVLAWNASGIGVVQQDRDGAEEASYDTVSNVTLNGNRILQDEIPGSSNHAAVFWNWDPDAVSAGAPSLYDPRMNNGGRGNAYWFDEPQGSTPRFKWNRQLRNLDDLNATPAEQNGRYLSERERDILIEENDLPAAPGDHSQVTSGFLSRVGNLVGWIRDMLP